MSLCVLAQGRLLAAPQVRVGKSGRQFSTFMLAVAVEDGEPVTVSCIAFDPDVVETLAKLTKGESIAASGRAKLATWVAKDGSERTGLSVVVDALLTAHHVASRRKAMQDAPHE